MDIQNYDTNIQQLLTEIPIMCRENADAAILLCKELYDIGEQTASNTLLGFACAYLGETYYFEKNTEQGMDYLSRSIKYLSNTTEWELLCKCYNFLGILLQNQGMSVSAIEYYWNGLKIAENHRLHLETGKLHLHLSSLCEANDDYEHALFYRRQALEYLEKCSTAEDYVPLLLSVHSLLLRLYIKLDLKEDAAETNQQIHQLLAQHPVSQDAMEILVNQLKYARWIQDSQEETRLKKRTIEVFEALGASSYIVECFDECITFAKYLLLSQEYEELERVLDTLEHVVGKSLYSELYLQVIQCRIEMYQAKGQEDKLAQATFQHYRISRLQRTETRRSLHSVLNLRIALKQAEVTTLFLTAEADTDELTNLPNRRKLNEEQDRLFERAWREGKSLGIEMLDIDHFKACNDTYGHSMGDMCIKKLGACLLEMNDENQFSARYGGDEFFIIYYGLTDEEILKRCEALRVKVAKLKEELGLERFTISQGIANAVPKTKSKVWDFTSAADEALYWVKNQGRDGVKLVHQSGELKE